MYYSCNNLFNIFEFILANAVIKKKQNEKLTKLDLNTWIRVSYLQQGWNFASFTIVQIQL